MPLSILWGSSAFQLMHQEAQSISKHVKAPEKLSVFFSTLSIQRPCSFALLSLKVGWKIVEAWRFGDKCDLAFWKVPCTSSRICQQSLGSSFFPSSQGCLLLSLFPFCITKTIWTCSAIALVVTTAAVIYWLYESTRQIT